ncbi:hypothetical protein MTR67_038911 [Solanum verrucosum]|uniref:DUF4283 domain-containing protein n=1 Tax=Solanum verrucosum TaxID=315347 RepID=A0AAF0ZNB4_SOLVR|nr:hypothetical protein MTR67_038911 [Solanum verrucosum]
MQSNNVKITLDDIKEEVAYWNSTIVCYVLGVNPSLMGQVALTKIVGLIGKPVKADSATATRQRLIFARVLVEVTLNQPLPNTIMFENEIGCIVEQKVEYEWKPILCTHCKNYGHEIQNCTKVAKEKGEEEERKGKQQDLAGQ